MMYSTVYSDIVEYSSIHAITLGNYKGADRRGSDLLQRNLIIVAIIPGKTGRQRMTMSLILIHCPHLRHPHPGDC